MSNPVKQYTLNDDQRDMVVSTMAYARCIAITYQREGIETEDLFQQAYLGLCDAADNYKPGGKARFTTFARRHVKESIEVFIQHYGRGRMLSRMPEDAYVETVPIEHPEGDGDDDMLALEEMIPDCSHKDYVEEAERIRQRDETVRSMMSCLTDEEQDMVRKFYRDNDCRQSEPIWKQFGMGKSAFYARLRAAIVKMKVFAQRTGLKTE